MYIPFYVIAILVIYIIWRESSIGTASNKHAEMVKEQNQMKWEAKEWIRETCYLSDDIERFNNYKLELIKKSLLAVQEELLLAHSQIKDLDDLKKCNSRARKAS